MRELRVLEGLSRFKRLRVGLEITPTTFDNFTGKIVKSYLVCVSEKFRELFSTEGGYKELHITPLLDEEGRAIYPKRVVKCSFCKDKRPEGVGTVRIPSKVSFEIAGPSELVEEVYSPASCTLKFKERRIEVFTTSVEEISVDVEPSEGFLVKIRGPALLRDPWHRPGESLRTRFLPSPSHLFSVNVYSIFRDRYFEVLWKLERALVEDHSSLHSVGKVWYYYDDKWLPALSGTVLFWARELDEELRSVLLHAALFGVGSGRASGFGDVVISPLMV